jgi:hypothetical protein
LERARLFLLRRDDRTFFRLHVVGWHVNRARDSRSSQHNEFATGDHEIIVSYNTNGNWSQLMEFSQIYVPEMLRIIISPADTGKPVSRL